MAVPITPYLRRLGVDHPGEPSLPGLFELHRAHAERVPYEVLWIWLDRIAGLDPAESMDRIARGRGGYCYHLNGAFSLLLRTLGYRVTRHVGGVQGTATSPAGASASHLVITVDGLPSPAAPHGRWLVDLGMGDGLYEPLPLAEGTYRQGPFEYTLRPSEAEPGGWRFDHDPRGAFLGMDFRSEPAEMPAFADMHRHLSTSPDSVFVQTAVVQRRDATGVDTLRGLVLSRIGDRSDRTLLATPEDYFAALTDLFGLRLDDVAPAERAVLWQRLTDAHQRWTDAAHS